MKHPRLLFFANSSFVSLAIMLCELPLFGQGTKPDAALPAPSALERIRARAETNDAEAQLTLGWMYDRGEGVPSDHEQAFNWWLKAAEQGQPVARYNVGVMYCAGQGVAQDYTNAAAWWRKTSEPMDTLATYQFGWLIATGRGIPRSYKDARDWWVTAAERGYAVAKRELDFVEKFFVFTNGIAVGNVRFATNTPIGDAAYRGYRTVKNELDFQSITFKADDGRYLENVHVIGVSPVSIFHRQTDGICCGETRLANLPPDLQQLFGYDPKKAAEYEEEKARKAAAAPFSRGHVSLLVRYHGVSKSLAGAQTTRESTNIALLSEIVSDYHKKSTYSEADDFMCADMAKAVWNQVKTRGIKAVILIGNVGVDIDSVLDANHAWVLAEVNSGSYLGLETTDGTIRYESDNARHYFGHAFANPRELNDYIDLQKQNNEALRKLNDALKQYELRPSTYAVGNADARLKDLQEIRRKLISLLSRSAP